MKIWKMFGCLALLTLIICGCVAMGKRENEAAAQETAQGRAADEPVAQQTAQPANTEEADKQANTAVAAKVYSEGLRYRSNGDGTCALAGLGTCTAAAIAVPPTSPAGDTVTEILPGALSGGVVGAVELPTTVTTLSAASFAGCARLSYIRVAAGNATFAEIDGALYTADGKTLLYCPAARGGGTLTLAAGIARIAAGAFADCTTLQTVVYQGTAAAWHTVIVGDDNAPLYAAGFRFTA